MKKTTKVFLLILGLVILFWLATRLYAGLSDRLGAAPAGDEAVKQQTAAPTQPTAAVDFTVLNAAGEETTLLEQVGQPIVVNMWATWCSPCRKELPAFDAAYADYGEQVIFMMVNLTDGSRDTLESVGQFVADAGYTFPVYYDTAGTAAAAYGVYSIPTTVFIDAAGNVFGTRLGSMSEDYLRQQLDAMLE